MDPSKNLLNVLELTSNTFAYENIHLKYYSIFKGTFMKKQLMVFLVLHKLQIKEAWALWVAQCIIPSI